MTIRPRFIPRSIFLSLVAFLLSLAIAAVLIRGNPVNAQSDSAVRSELTSLRDRVDRLESEVRGVSSRQNYPSSRSPGVPQQRSGVGTVNGQLVGRSDPMFERLSTLVIELKEQVNQLEKRVKTLETETAGRNR
ncbi:hypothetical protein V0288_22010 [Pannus brasiliensis CCIBt3594]|uniref:Uncharacterized protein n=1 Tax=Pannus brasiliensis CCIBt3594 TaxID=1427578 RepID=A0AAW9QX43_9CHRO